MLQNCYAIGSRLQYITDIAVQDDSFLVEGTGKGFSCDIYGTKLARFCMQCGD